MILKVLRPEAATEDGLARIRNEFNILSGLNLPGVIKAYRLEPYESSLVMVLEDIGGTSLDRILGNKPLPLGQFLLLATRIAGIIGSIHQQRITHKNVNPSHIIWNPGSGQLQLIGFDLADELPQLSVSLQPPTALEGNLAYISPEQTGRMNRPVDYRTDFYSLGVTFYRMLTGMLPFQAEDPLEWVHCHIARRPRPPTEVNPDLPAVISDILTKLLAKAAEDRYQSAYGLQEDLEHCLSLLRKDGRIEQFEIAQYDVSALFRIPQKLYGRQEEVRELLQAFERVSGGKTELLLVAGYSGIGKTSLVREIYRPVTEKRGYFISGKFDQYRRDIPYAPLIDAFSELIRQILSENPAHIAQYKDKFLRALGPNGQVVIEVIPEVELIIGRQPPVPVLGMSESQNRFKLVFQDFVRTLATGDHPLALFLDDLQWADLPSLQLIEAFVTDPALKCLLIIGAYRDNEVTATHPLMGTRDQISEAGALVQTIMLGPLTFQCVNLLLSETLKCGSDKTEALATLVIEKTNGNPFFLKQFLITLYAQGFILFDWDLKSWIWDLEHIKAAGFTDNVLDLMTSTILTLSPGLQEILSLAACIGNQFDLKTLALISETSVHETAAGLQQLLRDGLILPVSDLDSRLILTLASPRDSGMADATSIPDAKFKFVHDRVQQSAYLLVEERQRKPVHLKIGRLMLQNTRPELLEDRVFDIVGHFNIALDGISQRSERHELILLNLVAGKRAMRSAAFEPALKYCLYGIELLEKDSWGTQFELTLELYTLASQSASITGNFEKLDRLFTIITGNARSSLDMAGGYESKIYGLISQGKVHEALDIALEILRMLGLSLPGYPTAGDIQQGMEETKSSYSDIPIEDLINLPVMTDKNKLAIMRVAFLVTGASLAIRPELCLLMTFKQVSLSIKYGNTLESPYTYAGYGMILCGIIGDIESGYRFGKFALALLDKLNDVKFRSSTVETVNGHIWHYKQHLRTTLPNLELGYQSGLETGDLEHAGYSALIYCSNAYFAGLNLGGLEEKMASYNEGMRRIRAEIGIQMQGPYWQAVLNLLGKSEDPCLLIGEGFDQRKMLPVLEQTNNKTALAIFYVNMLVLCYLFENTEKALESAMLADKNKDGMVALFSVPVMFFYDSLTRLRQYPDSTPAERLHILEKVSGNQVQLRHLADHAPMNHLHKWHLVEAERARVQEHVADAIEHYDHAISLAKKNEYVQEEALANELAARFWLEKGKDDFARLHMTRAYRCYENWGAVSKVEDLKKRYPGLLVNLEREIGGITPERLDLSTVMKASQAISGEIILPQLLETMMRIVIENAGAQTGYLLLEKDGKWTIAAEGSAEKRGESASRVGAESEVPQSIINYVALTKERVVLADAAGSGRFTNDPYVRRLKVRSLLCAPLLSRGRLIGIMYLENNLATNVFTPGRVQLLEALLSQAAVSLENARVYEALRESEERFRALAETSSATILVYRQKYLYVNPASESLTGYGRDELLKMDFWGVVHPDSRDMVKERGLMRIHGKAVPSHYEVRIVRKDGRERWVDISTSLFQYEGQPAGLAVVIDITERKRAEAALEASEERFRAMMEQSTFSIQIMSPDGRTIAVNRAFEKLWGVTLEDLTDYNILQDMQLKQTGIMPYIEKAFSGEAATIPSTLYDARDTIRKGEKRWVQARIYPVKNEAGAIRNVILVHEDITERKRAEEGLAEAKVRADTYLDLMSHDIININQIGIGYLELALGTLEIGGEDKELLTRPLEAFNDSSALINNVKKLQRVMSGEVTLEKTDLGKVLKDVVDRYLTMPGRAITINYTPVSGCIVMANDLLHDLFSNIIGNSIKHSTGQVVIDVGFSKVIEGGMAFYRVAIDDNGPGISDSLKPLLFSRFEKGKIREYGRGLGLSLVKALLDSYHGKVWVEDRMPGDYQKGSRFVVMLPVAKA